MTKFIILIIKTQSKESPKGTCSSFSCSPPQPPSLYLISLQFRTTSPISQTFARALIKWRSTYSLFPNLPFLRLLIWYDSDPNLVQI